MDAIAVRSVPVILAIVALSLPVLVHGQEGDMDLEIRETLYSSEGAYQLSASEFDAMSDAFMQRARESDLSVDDIALSRIEATLSASAAAQGAGLGSEDRGSAALPISAVFFVLLVGLLGFIYSKMHHGGALGHGIGVTGMGKREDGKLPWVTH